MKTKFKTSPELQKKSILENRNFLNNQNYIKDSKNYFYLLYLTKNNIFLELISLNISILIIIIIIITLLYFMGYLLDKNIFLDFLSLLILILIIVFGGYFIIKKLTHLLQILFYYIIVSNKYVYYRIPFNKIKNNSNLYILNDFIIKKK